MFVKNCWYVAAWDHQLSPDKMFAITIINLPVVLYRDKQNQAVALLDQCCHRFAPLSMGRIEDGENIRCMYHGLKFNSIGKCIEIPGQEHIPETAQVRTFPVIEKHSWIWIWMGDAEQADESLIPPSVGFDDENWMLRSSNIDYSAYYELINDNLTDFSHLTYVHANSFKVSEEWARTRPKIERLERGIRICRWVLSVSKGEAGRHNNLKAEDTALWQTYDYLAPGILLMLSEIYPVSAVPADGVSPPAATAIPVNADFTSQAVTPMTDKSSRYFFSWGPRASDATAEICDNMLKIAEMAFAEDKVMIEAQQRNMDLHPAREILTSADAGPVLMRKVLQKMCEAENQEIGTNPVI